ncbi:hypothetical protein HER39_06940, partial [Arthrobacter deserti]|nr:hypothetical protein [Arthrobacter deserti]
MSTHMPDHGGSARADARSEAKAEEQRLEAAVETDDGRLPPPPVPPSAQSGDLHPELGGTQPLLQRIMAGEALVAVLAIALS